MIFSKFSVLNSKLQRDDDDLESSTDTIDVPVTSSSITPSIDDVPTAQNVQPTFIQQEHTKNLASQQQQQQPEYSAEDAAMEVFNILNKVDEMSNVEIQETVIDDMNLQVEEIHTEIVEDQELEIGPLE